MPTKRAPDVWDSAAFSSIFLASSFSCSQALSTPAHTQVTQTVRLHATPIRLDMNTTLRTALLATVASLIGIAVGYAGRGLTSSSERVPTHSSAAASAPTFASAIRLLDGARSAKVPQGHFRPRSSHWIPKERHDSSSMTSRFRDRKNSKSM